MSGPLIRFEAVALGYEGRPLLRGLSFDVEDEDFLGVVGPNGSGKTTILRALLGLIPPLEGSIRYLGNATAEKIHFGYVPQRQTVDEGYPITAFDVALMGRYRRAGSGRRTGAADRRAVTAAMEAAGVTAMAAEPFRTLSGGQKQRVLIARALATEPDLLVLDEPTSGMDLAGRESIMRLVDRLRWAGNLAVVLVSHDLAAVAKWVLRLGMLHAGELELGPVDEVLTDATLSRVYGPGAGVVTVEGQRVVLPPGGTLMPPALEILTLPFVRMALVSGLLIGGMCSYLGVFVVLRRIVFVGIALAQLAAVGVALSFYIPLPCEALALATTLGGALLLSPQLGGRFIPREAGIGFVYAAASATAILLVARSPLGETHVLGLLFGDILTLTGTEVIILGVVAGLVLIVHTLFYKEFLFTSFDPETARASGFRVGAWNVLFDLTLAAAIAMAIHAAGALLVFSYLIQPAVVGLLLGNRMRSVILIAVAGGLAASVLGLLVSVLTDLPTGPTVVAWSSVSVLAALALKRVRRRSVRAPAG